MLQTKEISEAYDSLPEIVKGAILALSVLVERISSLPKPDRNELFELIQDWRRASDPETQKSIRRAMEEVLAQVPVSVRKLELSGEKISGSRKLWAEHVGKKIRALRERESLTQVELARKAELPQSHISRLENAEYSPTNLTLEKIAKALNVTVGDIDPCSE